jgi:hypothetical protein
MSGLAQPDRAKLAKLLGLLGSDHAGERDAAALAAHRMVRARGLTWPEVIEPVTAAPPALPKPQTWQSIAAGCLERPDCLSTWESVFLAGLPRFSGLSLKQRSCLAKIADRVLGRRQA